MTLRPCCGNSQDGSATEVFSGRIYVSIRRYPFIRAKQFRAARWRNWAGRLPLFAISALIPICVGIAIVNTLQLPACRLERDAGRRLAVGRAAIVTRKALFNAIFPQGLERVTVISPAGLFAGVAIGYPPYRREHCRVPSHCSIPNQKHQTFVAVVTKNG